MNLCPMVTDVCLCHFVLEKFIYLFLEDSFWSLHKRGQIQLSTHLSEMLNRQVFAPQLSPTVSVVNVITGFHRHLAFFRNADISHQIRQHGMPSEQEFPASRFHTSVLKAVYCVTEEHKTKKQVAMLLCTIC